MDDTQESCSCAAWTFTLHFSFQHQLTDQPPGMWNIPDFVRYISGIFLKYSSSSFWLNRIFQVYDNLISIWQYKLDIYPLDLYIWHMPDIRLLWKFGGHHVTPYVCNIYHIYLHQVSICHIYGVTWWPPKFSGSSISGICQIYRSSGYMSSIC